MDQHEEAGSFNDAFVQMMYENYLSNPGSVSPEWQQVFGGKQANGSARPAAPAASAATATPPAAPPQVAASNGTAELPANAQLLKGPAAAVARNMNESLTVPVATTFRTIAVATLDAARRSLNEELKAHGRKLSFTHLVAWAIVESWREFPVMGNTFEAVDGKPYRIANPHINFGLAVDVEKPDGSRGLVVPIVHEADTFGARDFFDRYDELVQKARTGKLALEEMLGGTVTLTNPGGLGTNASVPRLMAHQGSIIATGAIAFPVEFQHLEQARLSELGVSKVMTVTSTYDHRVIQGAESGAFLRAVDQRLQGEHGFYESVRDAMLAAPSATPAAAATKAPTGATAQVTMADDVMQTAATGPAPDAVGPGAEGEGGAAARVSANGRGDDNAIMLEPGASLHEVHSGILPEPKAFPTLEAAPVSTSQDQLASVAAAMSLVKAYRMHGHLAARLDPLGTPPPGDPALDPHTVGLTEEIMRTIPASVLRIGVEGETFADALPRLREKYCGTIAYEIEHIADHAQRVWLRRMIEAGEHRRPLSDTEKGELLERLTDVEVFERFVRRAYLTQKQFSIEGVDAMVPVLDEIIDLTAVSGAGEVVIGMAHRGRLNVLAHIIGRPYESLLREFEAEGRVVAGTELPGGGTGDVKYHQGATGEYETPAGTIEVSLAPNPSHLEFVDPVVVGRTRAEQTLHKGRELHHDGTAAVATLIHGDAAFPGQGIVAETLNLQALEGYSTGGTIHVIANNQLGFTTRPHEGRSTRYASDLAKGFDVPIIHVNADDPEACVAAVRLAVAYRNRFHEDVVIDIIGYRRHGHNEGDEPGFTQPRMYAVIKEHPRVRELFARKLIEQGLVSEEDVTRLYDERYKAISAVHENVLALGDREPTELNEPTGDTIELRIKEEPTTTISEPQARGLMRDLLHVPDDFHVHPKLLKQLERRQKMLDEKMDWGTAESLALSSLLVEGVPVRLTGQDSERGTFSHRHMVLHDVNTGERYAPIQHLPEARAALEVHNSPLSEQGCVGFEYGYSIAASDSLVIWEAQFGDFVNGAQVISDQFIMSGRAKWGARTRLTMLLPHGYEGNGPEHSYAHIGRWLQGAAEGNVRIANPTTAAQFFHLLRRQGLHEAQRPLIVMTPKGLLRAPHAMSPLTELTAGRFDWVIDDPHFAAGEDKSKVTRLVLCSGKVYYDIAQYKQREQAASTAIARIELLYPFPRKQMAELLGSYPNLKEVVWAQEEPLNFGPYPYMLQRLPQLLPKGAAWKYVGRPKRSSPSEGYTSVHLLEQERIVREALGV